MKLINLPIKTDTQKYPIIIGSNLISKIQTMLKDNTDEFESCLLVIDKKFQKKKFYKLKKHSKIKNFIH